MHKTAECVAWAVYYASQNPGQRCAIIASRGDTIWPLMKGAVTPQATQLIDEAEHEITLKNGSAIKLLVLDQEQQNPRVINEIGQIIESNDETYVWSNHFERRKAS